MSYGNPFAEKAIKSLGRRNYKAAATNIASGNKTKAYIVHSVAYQIRQEMANICSIRHPSLLRDSHSAVKKFNWQAILSEFSLKLPTLILLLRKILPKSDDKFISFVISLLIKKRCKHMSLLQRVISVLLYGNGTSKEVYNCLQPFMVCMSPVVTSGLIDKIAEDYDDEVTEWMKELENCIEKTCVTNQIHVYDEHAEGFENPCVYDEEDCGVSDVESDISSPEWEPWDDRDDSNDASQFENDATSEIQQHEKEDMELPTHQAIDGSADCPPQSSLSVEPCSACGFVLVTDNVDKNIRPSYQRENRQTQSLHYCHSCAVKNCISVTGLSDNHASGEISVETFLPTEDDLSRLLVDFEILISRVLVTHMEQYKNQFDRVIWHIASRFAAEMASKSTTVPLGVQLKNEIYLTDMCSVLDSFNAYVPMEESTKCVEVNGEIYFYDDTKLIQLLLFGDQLTVALARSASQLRDTHTNTRDTLQGFVPVIADWHTRICLLEIIWKKFYCKKSTSDKGTLYQLKHLIHRTSVKCDPKHQTKASEDFLLVVLHAHIVAAARACGADQISDCLQCSKAIVSKFVNVHLPSSQEEPTSINDMAHGYAVDLLTLSLLWHGYHDAIKEGDGNRILLYWKFLLPIFQQEGHYNYAKEGFLLISQTKLLSERKLTELKWSHTVNMQGRRGQNIPIDLYMEHLNRRLKCMISNLSSNACPSSIQRVAKSLKIVHQICEVFRSEAEVTENKGYVSYPPFDNDF